MHDAAMALGPRHAGSIRGHAERPHVSPLVAKSGVRPVRTDPPPARTEGHFVHGLVVLYLALFGLFVVFGGDPAGALEATTTGLHRLAGLDIPFPVLDWNGIALKDLIHNRHHVGAEMAVHTVVAIAADASVPP